MRVVQIALGLWQAVFTDLANSVLLLLHLGFEVLKLLIKLLVSILQLLQYILVLLLHSGSLVDLACCALQSTLQLSNLPLHSCFGLCHTPCASSGLS